MLRMNHDEGVANLILRKVRNANPAYKMPLMYVMDSIMKNVTEKYIVHFGSQMEKLVPEIFPTLNLKDQNRLRHLVGTWRTMGTFTPRYVSLIEQTMRARTPTPPPQQDTSW